LPTNLDQMTGPQLYDAECSTCHQAHGQGSFDGGLPPLFHNTALGRTNTNNLVMVMPDGIHRETEPPEVPMPGFAKLSDRQLATLGTYLTQRYGNPDAAVTPVQVTTLRAGGAASQLVLLARLAIAAGIIAIIAVLVFFARRSRHSRSKAALSYRTPSSRG
jgi:cytochrome c553